MNPVDKPQNVLVQKSFSFAIRVINLYKYLKTEKKEYVISKQILRSGTSVGANMRETQNAQSKNDFIHKLSISQKECDETLYWLELLIATDFIEHKTFKSIHADAHELLTILNSAILSSKNNR